jgi:hypothetical protein
VLLTGSTGGFVGRTVRDRHFRPQLVINSTDLYTFRIGVVRHEALRAECKTNFSFDLVKSGYGQCLDVNIGDFQYIERTRVAVVAGGKQDDFETVRAMAAMIKKKCDGSRAFVVRKAIHGWDLQFPELFAQGVRAWVEEQPLPEEYEELV